jgi:tRNA(Phe) wybutosine-synthesizing methylase Tyw3
VVYRMMSKINLTVTSHHDATSSVERKNKQELARAAEAKLLNQKERLKRLNDNLSHMSRIAPGPDVSV